MTRVDQSLRFVDVDEESIDLDAIMKGFLPIMVRDLLPETILPFEVFCLARKPDTGGMDLKKVLDSNQIYGSSFHKYLADHNVGELYIRENDEQAFTDYFNNQILKALGSQGLSPEKKAELLYDQAEYIVKRVFREKPSRANILLGQQLVSQLSTQALGDKVTTRALFSLFSKDYYTFTHCIQVAILGMAFGKCLGWKPNEVEDFGMGALFHDVGKSAIDERILNKPGRLDKEEFEIIKSHPLLGYQQIRATQVMSKHQLSVVLHHHEAMDGSGYPHRLKDSEISRYARLARIVDVYDALTTERSYKKALTIVDALRIMNNEMRPTLDLRMFERFITFIRLETSMER